MREETCFGIETQIATLKQYIRRAVAYSTKRGSSGRESKSFYIAKRYNGNLTVSHASNAS